jgi:hypothetical protein
MHIASLCKLRRFVSLCDCLSLFSPTIPKTARRPLRSTLVPQETRRYWNRAAVSWRTPALDSFVHPCSTPCPLLICPPTVDATVAQDSAKNQKSALFHQRSAHLGRFHVSCRCRGELFFQQRSRRDRGHTKQTSLCALRAAQSRMHCTILVPK